MKYTLRTTNKFEKSVKRCIRRNYPMDELRKVMTLLVETGTLPTTYRSHKLQGKKGNVTIQTGIYPFFMKKGDSKAVGLSENP